MLVLMGGGTGGTGVTCTLALESMLSRNPLVVCALCHLAVREGGLLPMLSLCPLWVETPQLQGQLSLRTPSLQSYVVATNVQSMDSVHVTRAQEPHVAGELKASQSL